jgi:murein DD-endopeptidase MepM/ murein hydrolase activator NlpD
LTSENYLTHINNLSIWEPAINSLDGKGGPDTKIEPIAIQEDSILAHNPVDTNYISTIISGKRNTIVEYTVQPGDNLSLIARDYGVSVESIMWVNNLKDSNSIKEGNVLKIPPVSGVIHTVKKGDTIASLAKKYGVSEENIINYNFLPQNGELKINDELIIPDGKITTPQTPTNQKRTYFSHLPNMDSYFDHPTKGLGRISQWLHGRNGIDVAHFWGTPIYAAAEGHVVGVAESGWNGGYGLFVKIAHPNGTATLYAHLSKVLVTNGQTVQRGQQIGNMGSSGRSTGSHLHFEVHGAKNPLAK